MSMEIKIIISTVAKTFLKTGCKLAGINAYVEDYLFTPHDHEFVNDPAFIKAYARGIKAVGPNFNAGNPLRWRVHIALWAAKTASRLPGDFVECGTNKGLMASSIMEYLCWHNLDRQFYMLD